MTNYVVGHYNFKRNCQQSPHSPTHPPRKPRKPRVPGDHSQSYCFILAYSGINQKGTHRYTHRHTQTHTQTHTDTHRHTQTHTDTRRCTYRHTQTHKDTHKTRKETSTHSMCVSHSRHSFHIDPPLIYSPSHWPPHAAWVFKLLATIIGDWCMLGGRRLVHAGR